MKNNLNEEITRFKLLSGYNTKETLTENIKSVNKDLLIEQKKRALDVVLHSIFSGYDKKKFPWFDDLIKNIPKEEGITKKLTLIDPITGVKKGSTNADEIFNHLKNGGKLSVTSAKYLQRAIVSTPSSPTDLRNGIIKKLTSVQKTIDFFGSWKKDEIVSYYEKNGYSKEGAESLSDILYLKSKSLPKISDPKTGDIIVQPTPQPGPQPGVVDDTLLTSFKKFINGFINKNFTTFRRILFRIYYDESKIRSEFKVVLKDMTDEIAKSGGFYNMEKARDLIGVMVNSGKRGKNKDLGQIVDNLIKDPEFKSLMPEEFKSKLLHDYKTKGVLKDAISEQKKVWNLNISEYISEFIGLFNIKNLFGDEKSTYVSKWISMILHSSPYSLEKNAAIIMSKGPKYYVLQRGINALLFKNVALPLALGIFDIIYYTFYQLIYAFKWIISGGTIEFFVPFNEFMNKYQLEPEYSILLNFLVNTIKVNSPEGIWKIVPFSSFLDDVIMGIGKLLTTPIPRLQDPNKNWTVDMENTGI